jgi:hypothetical protein
MTVRTELLLHLLLHELPLQRPLPVLRHRLPTLSLRSLPRLLLTLILLIPLMDELGELPLALFGLGLHYVLVLVLARTDQILLVIQHVLVIGHVLHLLLSIELYVLYVLLEPLVLLSLHLVVLLELVLQALIKLLTVVILLVSVHEAFKL